MTVNLKRFAADPVEFVGALTIPAAGGEKPFSSCWGHFQREWFQAVAPALLAFAAGEKPPIGRFWSERTKGGSKDTDCACVLLWLLAFCPRKFDAQIGAADRDQAGELKKAAADILRLNPWLAQRVEVQAWTLLCPATGSACDIVASDVAGSHGARPDVVVLNELSHVTKEEFAQNLLDNASKKPHGLVIVATNAGFQGSWQERWRDIARTSDRWHFHSYCQPAPWLGDGELEEAERRNSCARFQRLYWGAWVSQSGDALDQADIDAAINATLQPGGRRKGESYIAGLDLGIKHDHSALVVLGLDRVTLEMRLVEAHRWKPGATGKVDLMAVEAALVATHKRYKLHHCGYDPYQAALMAQRLEKQRVPMHELTFSGANLSRMASDLLDTFRSRRLQLYNDPALIADLGRLMIEEKSYGHRLTATRTEAGHADLATALAIALTLTVELAGEPFREVGYGVLDADGSPFIRSADDDRYGRYWERRLAEYQAEQKWLSQPDDPQEQLRDALRYCYPQRCIL